MKKDNYILITETAIIYKPATQRYKVIEQWTYDSAVEEARSGLVDLFLTEDALVYVEVDMDPLYGGGYPKREKIQSLNDFIENGAIREVPESILKKIKTILSV